MAHSVMGDTLIWLGEFAGARAHLEQGMALYKPQQYRSHAFLYAYDLVHCLPLCRCHCSISAIQTTPCGESTTRSPSPRSCRTPIASPLPSSLRPGSISCAGKDRQSKSRQRRSSRSRRSRVCPPSGAGTICGVGAGRAGPERGGDCADAPGHAGWRATGAELSVPYWSALLAEAYGQAGQAGGLRVLAEALTVVYKTGDRHYEAELYRLKGELLLQQARRSDDEAETCLHQALDLARHQQAKSLELRAAMSLTRLWLQQGKQAEARALLAPIYGWFTTEGFDTADPQEARRCSMH